MTAGKGLTWLKTVLRSQRTAKAPSADGKRQKAHVHAYPLLFKASFRSSTAQPVGFSTLAFRSVAEGIVAPFFALLHGAQHTCSNCVVRQSVVRRIPEMYGDRVRSKDIVAQTIVVGRIISFQQPGEKAAVVAFRKKENALVAVRNEFAGHHDIVGIRGKDTVVLRILDGSGEL